MKVAISLPDPLFTAAERMAAQLHVSRSQLYAQALAEYMEKREDAVITQRLNQVHEAIPDRVDSALQQAQGKVLGDEAW